MKNFQQEVKGERFMLQMERMCFMPWTNTLHTMSDFFQSGLKRYAHFFDFKYYIFKINL